MNNNRWLVFKASSLVAVTSCQVHLPQLCCLKLVWGESQVRHTCYIRAELTAPSRPWECPWEMAPSYIQIRVPPPILWYGFSSFPIFKVWGLFVYVCCWDGVLLCCPGWAWTWGPSFGLSLLSRWGGSTGMYYFPQLSPWSILNITFITQLTQT